MEIVIAIIIITLSISLLVLSALSSKLYSTNALLKQRLSDLEKSVDKVKKESEQIFSIDTGDKAIIPNFGLKFISTGESFQVTYEVEILEVSEEKVKVKPLSFTGNGTIANDPKNKNDILGFMKDKWVPKKDIELIVDDQMKRDKKLQELGI